VTLKPRPGGTTVSDAAGGGVPPATSPAFLLMTLGGRIREQVEEGLRAEGISLRHLSALGHLGPNPGMSYSELARRARITPQSMQATLNALEQRGAVVRDTDPGRGRTAALHVTAEGERLHRAGTSIIAGIDERLRAQLGPEAADALGGTLWTVLRAATE
jgi:DNA-binding MarR family transcriptional regulator